MSAPKFSDLLSKPVDDVKKPAPWPAGTYFGIAVRYELGESNQKKTPYVRFILACTGAGEDIAPEDIEGVDFSKKSFRTDFYLTPDSEYRLKEFIESLGISTSGRTFGELLPECNGKEVLIEMGQRNSDDGLEIYNEVKRVRGVG